MDFREFSYGKRTVVLGADGQEDLANVDTGNGTVGLAEGTTHTGLETIGTSARQHLVDTDDVVGVSADTKVEGFLATGLDHVLVGANTGGLEGLRAQLLILVGDEMDASLEILLVKRFLAKMPFQNIVFKLTGNSSTFARLRPRSKIRILGSGTPRLKRDLGYGCRGASQLTFAEDIASMGGRSVVVGRLNGPCSCSSGSISRDDGPF